MRPGSHRDVAESDVSQKERDLAVSEAEAELAQQKLERSKLAGLDAKRAWWVALAKVEVVKSDAAALPMQTPKPAAPSWPRSSARPRLITLP